MIVDKNKMPYRPIEIDLTGPDGNAFVLLGYAKRLSRELGYDSSVVLTEMTEGDYEHLLEVFDRYFGDFVVMYR